MANTVNEMLFDTLTTKVEKTPKYKELLEDMGYTLEADKYEIFWSVNGIHFYRGRGFECTLYNGISRRTIQGKENLAKVDWKNLLATREERRAKNDAMYQQGNFRVIPTTNIVRVSGHYDENGSWIPGRRYEVRNYDCFNETIDRYHELKRKASEAPNSPYGYGSTNVQYAEKWLEDAKRDLEIALEKVQRAKKRIAKRERELAKEIEKAAAGKAELEAFLAEHNVRKAG